MKIEVDAKGHLVLKEVFSGVLMETSEGNQVGICMRDDTFEINVIPKKGQSQWFRVDMQDVTVMPEVIKGETNGRKKYDRRRKNGIRV